MTRKRIVVLLSLILLMPVVVKAADDKHGAESKKSSPRASEKEKKPSTLSEKISACLAERPAPKKSDDSEKPNLKNHELLPQAAAAGATNTPVVDGAPLFEQFCVRCHSGGLNSDKAIGKLSAGAMPPSDEPQPSAEEKQALIEYFSSKK